MVDLWDFFFDILGDSMAGKSKKEDITCAFHDDVERFISATNGSVQRLQLDMARIKALVGLLLTGTLAILFRVFEVI